jgi:hypothetical protein
MLCPARQRRGRRMSTGATATSLRATSAMPSRRWRRLGAWVRIQFSGRRLPFDRSYFVHLWRFSRPPAILCGGGIESRERKRVLTHAPRCWGICFRLSGRRLKFTVSGSFSATARYGIRCPDWRSPLRSADGLAWPGPDGIGVACAGRRDCSGPGGRLALTSTADVSGPQIEAEKARAGVRIPGTSEAVSGPDRARGRRSARYSQHGHCLRFGRRTVL